MRAFFVGNHERLLPKKGLLVHMSLNGDRLRATRPDGESV